MQVGVLYKLFVNYTALKWRPEKNKHNLAPELVAYALTRGASADASRKISDVAELYIFSTHMLDH